MTVPEVSPDRQPAPRASTLRSDGAAPSPRAPAPLAFTPAAALFTFAIFSDLARELGGHSELDSSNAKRIAKAWGADFAIVSCARAARVAAPRRLPWWRLELAALVAAARSELAPYALDARGPVVLEYAARALELGDHDEAAAVVVDDLDVTPRFESTTSDAILMLPFGSLLNAVILALPRARHGEDLLSYALRDDLLETEVQRLMADLAPSADRAELAVRLVAAFERELRARSELVESSARARPTNDPTGAPRDDERTAAPPSAPAAHALDVLLVPMRDLERGYKARVRGKDAAGVERELVAYGTPASEASRAAVSAWLEAHGAAETDEDLEHAEARVIDPPRVNAIADDSLEVLLEPTGGGNWRARVSGRRNGEERVIVREGDCAEELATLAVGAFRTGGPSTAPPEDQAARRARVEARRPLVGRAAECDDASGWIGFLRGAEAASSLFELATSSGGNLDAESFRRSALTRGFDVLVWQAVRNLDATTTALVLIEALRRVELEGLDGEALAAAADPAVLRARRARPALDVRNARLLAGSATTEHMLDMIEILADAPTDANPHQRDDHARGDRAQVVLDVCGLLADEANGDGGVMMRFCNAVQAQCEERLDAGLDAAAPASEAPPVRASGNDEDDEDEADEFELGLPSIQALVAELTYWSGIDGGLCCVDEWRLRRQANTNGIDGTLAAAARGHEGEVIVAALAYALEPFASDRSAEGPPRAAGVVARVVRFLETADATPEGDLELAEADAWRLYDDCDPTPAGEHFVETARLLLADIRHRSAGRVPDHARVAELTGYLGELVSPSELAAFGARFVEGLALAQVGADAARNARASAHETPARPHGAPPRAGAAA